MFDWDGTIIDSAATIADCIRDASRELGLQVPDRERASHVIGLGLHDAMRIAVPELPAERYPEFVASYREHFLVRKDSMQLFEGMRQLLTDLCENPSACHRDRQKSAWPRPRLDFHRTQAAVRGVALRRRDQPEAAPGDAARADGRAGDRPRAKPS